MAYKSWVTEQAEENKLRAVQMKKENPEMSFAEIAVEIGVTELTVRRYLSDGQIDGQTDGNQES